MRALALCALALAACSMSKSAERQDSFGQEAETRRDEGPWTREVWEYAPAETAPQDGGAADRVSGSPAARAAPSTIPPGPALRHILEKHDPVVSTTTTTTKASGEAHTASASRFGFSPWQWAIGAVVLACGLYGAFWVKRKLAI